MTKRIQHSSVIREELEHQSRMWGVAFMPTGYYVEFSGMWKGPFTTEQHADVALAGCIRPTKGPKQMWRVYFPGLTLELKRDVADEGEAQRFYNTRRDAAGTMWRHVRIEKVETR